MLHKERMVKSLLRMTGPITLGSYKQGREHCRELLGRSSKHPFVIQLFLPSAWDIIKQQL